MGGGTKRGSPESEGSTGSGGGGGGGPSRDRDGEKGGEAKRPRLVNFEPVRIGFVWSVSELDASTLSLQNRNLNERLAYRNRVEAGLRKRLEAFQERQAGDDALIAVVNRHWNRLDSDIHTLLARFDAETTLEDEGRSEDPSVSAFLLQLSQWEEAEAETKLRDRVEFSRRAVAKLVQTFDRLSQRNDRLSAAILSSNSDSNAATNSQSNAASAEALEADYVAENKRLRALVTSLHASARKAEMRQQQVDDERALIEARMEERETSLAEAEFQLAKEMQRSEKLEYRLAACWKELEEKKLLVAQAKEKSEGGAEASTGALETVSKGRLGELETQLEDAKELAASRLTRIQQLTETSTQVQVELERAKLELRSPPPALILNSPEYRNLQSHFTLLHQEAGRIREHAEALRTQLVATKAAHLAQVEQLEAEELLAQKQLRHEMIQLEEQLSQVRREYEMLRLEFEQNLAANEQSAPVNREMRHLLQSCRTQIQQLKSEVGRYKKRWKDGISTIAKIQKELDSERRLRQTSILVKADEGETETEAETGKEEAEEEKRLVQGEENGKAEELLQLRREVKALRARVRETGKTEESLEKEREARVPDDALKRIRHLEEAQEKLKKEASDAKATEDTLLNEMESTGQAFEEMQEQNQRLLQQLREKDEANLKLMSERIRWNQEQKKLKEETELREEEVGALRNQVEAQNLVVRKLEEKEREMGTSLGTLEKEVSLRSAAVELNKRKALELAQSTADLKLQVEKLSSQLRDSGEALAGKTTSLGDQALKLSRLEEEVAVAKKEVERARRLEKAGAVDQVLMEEIREYKQQLTCSSCKVNKKDGLLTKCCHVFCMDCITKRYQLRKRKCPTCNLNFGANDFKRIYVF